MAAARRAVALIEHRRNAPRRWWTAPQPQRLKHLQRQPLRAGPRPPPRLRGRLARCTQRTQLRQRPPQWTLPPTGEAPRRTQALGTQPERTKAALPVMHREGRPPGKWRTKPRPGQQAAAATAFSALHRLTARPPGPARPRNGRKRTPRPAALHRLGDDGQFPWSAPMVVTRSTCAVPPMSPTKPRPIFWSLFACSITVQSFSSQGTPRLRTCTQRRPSISGTPHEGAMATWTTASASSERQASGSMTCRCFLMWPCER